MGDREDDDSDPGDIAYDNSHRAFLQVFLSRSTLTFAKSKPILAQIQSAHLDRQVLPEDITEADFNSYINSINHAISPFDLEIRHTLPQTAIRPQNSNEPPPQRSRIYALVNTTSDAATQLATTHTAAEIAFVKRMLDDMFDKYNTPTREVMAISSMQALGLARPPAGSRTSGVGVSNGESEPSTQANTASSGLTKGEAEKTLQAMVDEGWFLRQGHERREYYMLSPRALMELRGWLLETYNEPADEEDAGVERIKHCHACREIVTIGQRCKTRECKVRLHDICTRTLGPDPKCPACAEAWTGRDFVGLRALRSRDSEAERA